MNTTLSNLQSQYDLISISGLLNNILYLNSVDTYFNYYVETLSGQINSINNSLSKYSDTAILMNNVTDLNNYTISFSGRIQNYYVEEGSKNYYLVMFLVYLEEFKIIMLSREQKIIIFQHIYFL